MGQKLGVYVALLIFTSCLDFGVHTIYEPSVCKTVFDTVIIAMTKIVTILFQFFSWFFMISSRRIVRITGFESVFHNFWILFVTTLINVLLFLAYIVVLFTYIVYGARLPQLWNQFSLITLFSIQRLFACIHYAFSMFYMIKIALDPLQYL